MGNSKSRRKPCQHATKDRKIEISMGEAADQTVVSACLSSEDLSIPPQTVSLDSTNEDNEAVFYKFVILHAESDISDALRMKTLLQDTLQVKPGLIFAEMPAGQHILKTLEDAVNGSAWTIILLTENFVKETWCEFQSHAMLINSINNDHKYNTVIPVRPKDNYLPRDRTPFPISLINALEEQNSEFTWLVERTFQESKYQKQYAIWKAEKMSA
ncbi:TIR domain-containing adapter molecule 2 [Gastrophryne carolinensis]